MKIFGTLTAWAAWWLMIESSLLVLFFIPVTRIFYQFKTNNFIMCLFSLVLFLFPGWIFFFNLWRKETTWVFFFKDDKSIDLMSENLPSKTHHVR